MKIEFHSLDFNAFKSFDEGGINLDQPGLYFVHGRNEHASRMGSNGSGKSTLFDALCWCLYGRTPDGLRTTDVKPWNKKSDPWASVVLTKSGKAYEIERDAKEGLFVANKKASQETVDDLIGMNFETFTNTVLLGQGQPLFFDRTPTDKMNLLANVLDLSRFDDYSKAAADQVRELEEKAGKVRSDYDMLNGKAEAVEDQIKSLEESAKRWDAENRDAGTVNNDDIAKLEKEIERLDAENAKAQLAYDGAEAELRWHRKEAVKLADDLRAAQRVWDKYDLEMREAERQRDEAKRAEKGKTCPVCHQPIKTKEAKALIGVRLKRMQQRLKEGIPNEVTKAVSMARAAVIHNNKFIDEFSAKSNNAIDTLDRTGTDGLRLKVQAMKERVAEAENPYRAQIASAKRALKEADAELRKLDALLEQGKEVIERVRFWVKGFKDIRLYVLEEVLDELELHTNSALEEVGLIGWEVLYDIERETKSGTISRGITVNILSPHNTEPVRWESWSGGEAQRLRLIGAASVSEVLLNYAGVQPNLEILDEPTTSLSEEGIDDLIDYLADRARRTQKTIFYIDHRVVETAQFDHTVEVVKDKFGSYVNVQ